MKNKNILLILVSFLLTAGCAYAGENDYLEYKTITVDHTKVASDLTNFPMLVEIKNDTYIGKVANPDGTDINFFSSNGEQLAFERESFSISNGVCNANFWVKIPFLSSTTDTTIYMRYGNPNAIDAQNAAAVWDDGGAYNYTLVQHLDSNPSGSSPQFIDSTIFHYNGASLGGMTGSNLVSGQINKAINFNGKGNYIQFDYNNKDLFDKSVYNPMIDYAQFGSMWYSGPGQYDAWYGAPNRTCIMHATSTDGNNWTTDPNPALIPDDAGSWDSTGVEVPYVWKENSTWYMLFRGRTTIENEIGLATSTDGENWTKYADNPVLSASSSGWEVGVNEGLDPWGLIKIGSVYYLWYNTVNPAGDHTRMTGLATSTDLIHWTKDPNNPIFTGGRYCTQEFKYGDYYYMLVPLTTGFIELYRDKNPTFYPSERSYLGNVISTDPSSWESELLDNPSILSNDIYRNSFPSSNLQMYYTGGTASYNFKEGLATFPLSKLDTLPKLPDAPGTKLTALTMEGWINASSSPLRYSEIMTKRRSYGLVLQTVSSNNYLTTEMKTDTSWRYTAKGNIIIPKNSWHHVAATYNAMTGTVSYYVDGNFDSRDTTNCKGPVSISSYPFWLSAPESNAGITGREDEIRISNIDRPAGYFKTEYNNQYSPETFYTIVDGPNTPLSPVAGFSSNVTSGEVPLIVNFTDTSTGSPTSWSWDFGDGSNSTQQNTTHVYSREGNYTVSITVTNDAGSNTTTKVNYIQVIGIEPAEPPVAGFSSNVTSGNAPLTVSFTDNSTGSPTSWSWDFGDGTSNSTQSPIHTYLTAGNYTVLLTVTNDAGSNMTTKADYIRVTEPPEQPVCNASTIYGYSFNDVDKNGYKDSGEAGLPNRAINLDGYDTCKGTLINKAIVTNSTGYFEFTGIDPGVYVISESFVIGWLPTTEAAYTLTVPANSTTIKKDFGNNEFVK